MNIEPPNLNIALERKERWGLVLLFASVIAVCVTAIFNTGFAIVLTASCIVGLPVLWLLFFPPHLAATVMQRGRFGRFGIYLLLLAYLTLSKKVLVPVIVRLIEGGLQ